MVCNLSLSWNWLWTNKEKPSKTGFGDHIECMYISVCIYSSCSRNGVNGKEIVSVNKRLFWKTEWNFYSPHKIMGLLFLNPSYINRNIICSYWDSPQSSILVNKDKFLVRMLSSYSWDHSNSFLTLGSGNAGHCDLPPAVASLVSQKLHEHPEVCPGAVWVTSWDLTLGNSTE